MRRISRSYLRSELSKSEGLRGHESLSCPLQQALVVVGHMFSLTWLFLLSGQQGLLGKISHGSTWWMEAGLQKKEVLIRGDLLPEDDWACLPLTGRGLWTAGRKILLWIGPTYTKNSGKIRNVQHLLPLGVSPHPPQGEALVFSWRILTSQLLHHRLCKLQPMLKQRMQDMNP
jgi:hypothetical protein